MSGKSQALTLKVNPVATSEKYQPGEPPKQASDAVRAYLDEELKRIADCINVSDGIQLDELTAAPAKPSDGMLVYADGTNWNPGSGEGFYGYENGAWVKL